MPLHFEPNRGQVAAGIRYVAPVRNAVVYLTDQGIVFNGAVTLEFEGADRLSPWIPATPAVGATSYIQGRDPSKWLRDIPHFARMERKGIYPGIDLVLYGAEGRLEYDFILAPGADPARIRLRFDGARSLKIAANGDLIVSTSAGELLQRKPHLYQAQPVEGRYRILGPSRAAFDVGTYDRSRPLTIDPVLESASLLGGSGDDKVAFADPRLAIVGSTSSADFPGLTLAPHRGIDIFLYSPQSQSTYIIGGSGDDIVTCASIVGNIAFGARLVIGGYTNSRDFPVITSNGYSVTPQTQYGGGDWDGFVIVTSPGSYSPNISTYLGGSGDDRVLAVDGGTGLYGMIGAAGSTTSKDFPLTRAWQTAPAGGVDGFVTLLNQNGVLHSSYLGGSDDDRALALSITSDTEFYVAGETRSNDWSPGTATWNGSRNGPSDGFVLHLRRDSAALPFAIADAALYGGSGEDSIAQLAAMPSGSLAVAGVTHSSDFTAAGAPVTGSLKGDSDVFLVKTSADLKTTIFGALIGGAGAEEPLSLATNSFNELLLAGWTTSADFPLNNPLQPQYGGGASDGFLYHVDSAGQPIFSTYYGGSGADRITWAGFDDGQRIFIGGISDSPDLPLSSGATDVNAGGLDGFYGALTVAAIRAEGVTAGKDLATPGYARLGDSKNSIGVPLTIASGDPASVLLAARPDDAGQPSLTTSVRASLNDLSGRAFLVYCLTGTASVPLTLSAPGYATHTITARCVPSAIYVGGPEIAVHSDGSGVSSGQLNAYTAAFDPDTGRMLQPQNPRGGMDAVRVDAISSNTDLLALDQASVTIDGFSTLVVNNYSYNVSTLRFSTRALGSADLVLSTNSSFSFIPSNRVRVRSTGPALTLYVPPLAKDLVDGVYVTLSPAPRVVPAITLTSSDASKLRLTPSPYVSGTATISVPCDSYSCRTFAEVLDSNGPVSITVSAPGSDPVTVPVPIGETTAGFYDASARPLASWALPASGTLAAYIRINANPPGTQNVYPSVPKLRAGAPPQIFSVTSTNPSVATVSLTNITIGPGQDLLVGPMTITAKADGSTSLSLSFKRSGTVPQVLPNLNPLALTVYGAQWSLGSVTLGNNLQAQLAVSIPGPYTAAPPPITIASADSSRLLISTDPAQPGQASITVQPQNYYTSVYLQALADSGDVAITASIPSGATAKGVAHLVPSGLAWSTEFIALILSGTSAPSIVAYALDPANLAPLVAQAPRAGLDGGIPLHNSNSAVAAVAPDSVSFASLITPAFNSQGNLKITPIAPGETLVDFAQPPGFVAPAGRHPLLRVKVAKPAIVLPNILVGRNMQIGFSPAFSGQTPDSAALPPLTFTSADSSKLVISVAAGDLGAASATVRHASTSSYPPNSSVYAPVWVQALDGPADVPVTASITGYDDVATVVQIVPTSLAFSVSNGGPAINTNTQADPVAALVYAAPVYAGSQPGAAPDGMVLRAGLPSFPVPIASSNPAVAAAMKDPFLNALTTTSPFMVKPLAPGTTQLTLAPPPGFVAALPAAGRAIAVTVTAPSFTVSDVLLGRDLQVQMPLAVTNGASVAAADLDVTLTSGDPSKLLIGSAANLPGAPSLTLHFAALRQASGQVFLQALDDSGTVTLQVSAPGYKTTNTTVTLARTALVANSTPGTLQIGNSPSQFQIKGVPVPTSGAPSYYIGSGYTFRAGLTPFRIGVGARDAGVVSVTPSHLDVSGGTGDMTVSVTAAGAGSTAIVFDVPSPYLAPPSIPFTVQGGQLSWYNLAPIGKDLQLGATLSGGNNLAGVKVTSSDPARLLVSLAASTPGQASVTLPQSAVVYLQSLSDSGTVTLTASGAGYTTASTQVLLAQTAVVLGGGIPPTASTLAGPVQFQAYLTPWPSPNNNYSNQSLRPGAVPVTVPINLSDVHLATATPAQLVFNPGDISKTFALQPLAAGSLLVSLGVPAGFADPLAARQTLIGLIASQLSITGAAAIGKDLQNLLAAVLTPSSAQTVTLTLSVSDPGSLEIGNANSVVLGPTLKLPIAGATSFSIAGLAAGGKAAIQATAAGLPAVTFNVTLQPTGFHFSSTSTTVAAGATATVPFGPAMLDAATLLPVADYPLRADLPLAIPITVTTSDPSIASVPPLVYFYGGDSRRNLTITGKSPGVATITLTAPAGYATPASGSKVTITVH